MQHIDFMRCGLPCACMFAQGLQCKFVRVGVARACHMLVHSSCVSAAQLQRAPACFRARMEKLGLLDPSLLDTIAGLPADEVIAFFRDVSSGLTMDSMNCRWRNSRSWAPPQRPLQSRWNHRQHQKRFHHLGLGSILADGLRVWLKGWLRHRGLRPNKRSRGKKGRGGWMSLWSSPSSTTSQSGDSLLGRWTRQVWCGVRLVGGAPRRYARGSAIFSIFHFP